jgi:uncharacterized protein YdhG (YjbR/CyaY superfamily)
MQDEETSCPAWITQLRNPFLRELSMNQAKSTIKKEPEKSAGFTAEEKAAMKQRTKELKAEAVKADGEKAVREAIAGLEEPERSMARRLHEIVKASAPGLSPKTWYGMPAYANPDGKVVCFFQSAAKFKTRYATFGFQDSASLDEGNMWPTSYALTKLTAADEARIAELVKKAVG